MVSQMPSVTVLYVIVGTFLCYYSTKFSSLITEKKAKLFQYMALAIIESYPLTIVTIICKIASCFPYSVQIRIMNYLTQGYCVHVTMRKKYIEECIRSAVEDGTRQVVVCAAGLDMTSVYIASELKQIRNLKFFELDLGLTQKYKTDAISKLKKMNPHMATVFDKINYVSCDLSTDDWNEKLLECGFDPKQPSVIIAEGLTMYLNEAEVSNFLSSVRKNLLQNIHSLFVTSFLVTKQDNIQFKQKSKIINFILKSNKKPYKFTIQSKKIFSFCESLGLKVIDFRSRNKFQKLAGNHTFKKELNDNLPENYYIMRCID